jgi:hypothetical protein
MLTFEAASYLGSVCFGADDEVFPVGMGFEVGEWQGFEIGKTRA